MRRFLPLLIALAWGGPWVLAAADKPVIAVTLPPLQGLVDAVAGDAVEVLVLVPPGASHERFEPRPSQLRALRGAQVLLHTGATFETAWLPRFRAAQPGLRDVDIGARVDRLAGVVCLHGHGDDDDHEGHDHHHHPEEGDPHIWLSYRNAPVMARAAADAIVRVRPDLAETVAERLRASEARWADANRALAARAEALEVKAFMVYHPAFAYAAHEYGLTMISIETDGKEPSPAQLARLMQEARDKGVRVLVTQPEFPLRGAETIARALNLRLASVTATPRRFEDALEALVRALEAPGP